MGLLLLLLAAVRCAGSPQEPAVEDVLERAAVELRASDKWVRKSAVERLARLASAEAVPLLLEALADPKGEVADTAQWQLGRLDAPDLFEALLGRAGLDAKDAFVRVRAAEILGRLPGRLAGARLLSAHGGEPELRRTLLWSVERRARADGLLDSDEPRLGHELARAAARERDGGVRARALFALAALGPSDDLAAAVAAALKDKDEAVRCAATALLFEALPFERAVAALTARAADESRVVRTQAVDTLAESRSRAGARALVARLEAETEARLGWRIVERLQGLSGLKHRADARPWRDWAALLPEGWRGAVPVAPSEPVGADRSASFVGLPLVSKRLAFLIDLSGSIWIEREGRGTRKEVVDVELARALEGLPADAAFNLIPFTSEPLPWSDGLVQATPRNVKRAVRWFEECDESGTGNVWDALMLALDDPEVDTVVVLSDGAPTGGRRFHLDLLPALFLERNATRKVTVDVLLVGASRKLQGRWGELARASGGRSLALDL